MIWTDSIICWQLFFKLSILNILIEFKQFYIIKVCQQFFVTNKLNLFFIIKACNVIRLLFLKIQINREHWKIIIKLSLYAILYWLTVFRSSPFISSETPYVNKVLRTKTIVFNWCVLINSKRIVLYFLSIFERFKKIKIFFNGNGSNMHETFLHEGSLLHESKIKKIKIIIKISKKKKIITDEGKG